MRRQWTDEEKASLVAAFHVAGPRLDAFDRQQDVPASTLWNWVHPRGIAPVAGGVPQPIEVVSRAVPPTATGAWHRARAPRRRTRPSSRCLCVDARPVLPARAHLWRRRGRDHARAAPTGELLAHPADAHGTGGDVLDLLADQFIISEVPEAAHVSNDETPQPVLQKGGTRRGRMWAFIMPRAIVYRFDASRGGMVVEDVLGDSSGVLHVDGYCGYNRVTVPNRRRRAGCWSHARRRLFEVRGTYGAVVEPMLDDIGRLFDVEVGAAGRGLYGTDAHHDVRQAESRPVVDRLFKALCDAKASTPPRSALGEALAYALSQETALGLFLDDPKVALGNNVSERALRVVALLRKNAVFVGHTSRARTSRCCSPSCRPACCMASSPDATSPTSWCA